MEIEIDKESSFTLEMKIDGEVSSAEPPKMRFSIIKENIIFSLNANRVDNGIYEITIPKLKGILEAGDYVANVEVFIDGKHFIPLTENIKLKQNLKPSVKLSENVKESSKSVTLDNINIKKSEVKPITVKKTDQIVTVKK